MLGLWSRSRRVSAKVRKRNGRAMGGGREKGMTSRPWIHTSLPVFESISSLPLKPGTKMMCSSPGTTGTSSSMSSTENSAGVRDDRVTYSIDASRYSPASDSSDTPALSAWSPLRALIQCLCGGKCKSGRETG